MAGRPKVLTDEVKAIITKIKDRHPTWSIRVIEKKLPEFWKVTYPKKPVVSVGRTAIAEYLHPLKTNQQQVTETGLDREWSLASLSDYPLPPQTVVECLGLVEWIKTNAKDSNTIIIPHPLTIRQALWVERLLGMYGILKEGWLKFKHNKGDRYPSLRSLWCWSDVYASNERISDLAGIKQLNSRDLDNVFWDGDAIPIAGYTNEDDKFESIMLLWADGHITHLDIVNVEKESEV